MASSRLADAASLTPYPSGIVQGRAPNAANENSDHARQTSRSRKGARPRARGSSRPEEERFNIGPVTPRSGTRRSRNSRQDRSVPIDANDVVPNYPPPSFQEATATPAMSICPSTLTLLSTSVSPTGTLIHATFPSMPLQSPAASQWPPTDASNADPESNSDSDDSLQIIDSGSIPPDHSLPSGSDLDTRVRQDWLHRRGVQFPSPSSHATEQVVSNATVGPEARGRSQQRPTLDLAAILDSPDTPRSPTISSPKRRFLSLSPLRTIFPSRNPNPGDRPQTAHPTPGTSPYLQSPKGSTFFRSTTSLATSSFLRLPLTSITNNGKTEKRKLFSTRSKEKPKSLQSPEALDAWEELSVDDVEQTPTSLLSVVESACSCASPTMGTSPTRSVSFTYGAPAAETYRSLQASISPTQLFPTPQPQAENPAHSIHPLSLRDRKIPFVQRPVRRSPAPTPPRIQVPIPIPLEPVLTTVRTRMPQATPPPPSPPPQTIMHRNTITAQVTRPSPLSLDALPPLLSEKAALDASFWNAVRTPLPTTPVKAAHATGENSPAEETSSTPSSPSPRAQLRLAVRSPIPGRPDGMECGVSKSPWTPPLIDQPAIFSRAPSPFVDEPITPTRHYHYPGRPLPRPPGQPRPHIDSTFAPNEEFSESLLTSGLPTCPEGLLIDFNDGASLGGVEAESSSFAADLVDLSPVPEPDTSIFAPVPLSAALEDLTFMPTSSSTPPPLAEAARDPQRPRFLEITDLDLLASQIAEDEQMHRDGTNYDVSSSPAPPSPSSAAGRQGTGEAGAGVPAKKVQTLNTLHNEGLAYGGGVYRSSEPSYQSPPPSRISWKKPGDGIYNGSSKSNIIFASSTTNSPSTSNSAIIIENSSNATFNGSLPARILLDPHHRQRQWQYLPSGVY